MSDFIPGLELGMLFYLEAVKPVLDGFSESLQYSAAQYAPYPKWFGNAFNELKCAPMTWHQF